MCDPDFICDLLKNFFLLKSTVLFYFYGRRPTRVHDNNCNPSLLVSPVVALSGRQRFRLSHRVFSCAFAHVPFDPPESTHSRLGSGHAHRPRPCQSGLRRVFADVTRSDIPPSPRALIKFRFFPLLNFVILPKCRFAGCNRPNQTNQSAQRARLWPHGCRGSFIAKGHQILHCGANGSSCLPPPFRTTMFAGRSQSAPFSCRLRTNIFGHSEYTILSDVCGHLNSQWRAQELQVRSYTSLPPFYLFFLNSWIVIKMQNII